MKNHYAITAIGCLVIALSFLTSIASGANEPAPFFKTLPTAGELFSKEDFSKAGLEKLTPQELAHLDSLLLKLANAAATIAKSKQAPVAETNPGRGRFVPDSAVIESQIDGDFEGWSGETIFKLTNGQIWQQASYDYEYTYSFMPEVTIYRSATGYKMKVEDMSETIDVVRLK